MPLESHAATIETASGGALLRCTTVSGTTALRSVPRMLRDPLAVAADIPGTPGLVQIKLPIVPVFLVRSAEHAQHVLVSNQNAYRKGDEFTLMREVVGDGLITNLDPASWRRQRAMVQPMFAKRNLGPFAAHMVSATAAALDRWEHKQLNGIVVDASAEMHALTLDVVGRALFGNSLAQDAPTVGNAMTELMQFGMAMIRPGLHVLGAKIPGLTVHRATYLRPFQRRRAVHNIDAIDAVVARLITAHRIASDSPQDNLLALLLSSRDADGAPMSHQQVRDEVISFLGAGHETSSNALTWLWYLFSFYPDARQQLHEEVDSVLGGRLPTADDVERLPWTNACFYEALRLYPPVPIITRVACEDDEVDGVRVPRGSLIAVLTYMIHRDPRWWPDPEAFAPERFMPGRTGQQPRLAFMPYGAGRRICIGNGFATMEGVLLGAMIAQRFQFDLVPGIRVLPEPTISLRPLGAVPMTIRRRT